VNITCSRAFFAAKVSKKLWYDITHKGFKTTHFIRMGFTEHPEYPNSMMINFVFMWLSVQFGFRKFWGNR
jgi:hypothetical protein